MKQLLTPLLMLAMLVLGLAACSDAPATDTAAAGTAGSTPPDPNTPASTGLGEAPDFTLPTLAGDSLRLSDLRGQIVVLNFWATWCAPCIEEIPELIKLHDELNPHGLTVLGVSLDEEGPDLIKPFTDRFGITYPIPLDDGAVAEAYGGIWALPTTYVIDAEGQIVQRVIGLFPVEEMRPQFREMLNVPAETAP